MKLLVTLLFGLVLGAQSMELMGYLENWVDVKWWDNNIPGNCRMGCFEPQPYIAAIAPYSAMNYGFSLLTEEPNPAQVDCKGHECPPWDGRAIYLANAGKAGSHAIDLNTTTATPGISAIAEAARMAHMHPDGPKRFKICLGGWSDWARLANTDNAKSIAKLMSELVLWTFSDGIDLDFEHLTPFDALDGGSGKEFAAFSTLITELRTELDGVAAKWATFAAQRSADLQKAYDALPNWQKSEAAPYYNSTIKHLAEVATNGPNHLEISWTTRFNAFVPKDNVWNYLMPDSPVPNQTFATDNEGFSVYTGAAASAIDTVNIMVYDAGSPAGPLKLNFTTIMNNFATLGNVPADKINIGFEPGEQAGGGVWEGMEVDMAAATYAKDNGFLGAMIWAVNPSKQTNPKGSKLAPELASNLKTLLNPAWRWGKAPVYTKCDPTTGWWPGL